jgi:uncharacterized membrane protein
MSQPPDYPGSPAQPPPPPGYGPPPAGYAPPPPGYPPQPGYVGPPGGQPTKQFKVGAAFSWAMSNFSKNAAAFIVSGLVYGVVLGGIYAVMVVASTAGETVTTSNDTATTSATTELSGTAWAVLGVGYVLIAVVALFGEAAFVSGCLDIADGKRVSIGTFFKPRRLGMAILAGLLVGVLTSAASSVLFFPGLLVAIIAQFTVPFVIDKSRSAFSALGNSVSTAWADIGNALLSWLLQVVVIIVGTLACGVGLLIAVPIAALIEIYTYRKLSGGQVVERTQPGYQPWPPAGAPPGPQVW